MPTGRKFSLTSVIDKPVAWTTQTIGRQHTKTKLDDLTHSSNNKFSSTVLGSLVLSKILQWPFDMMTEGLTKKIGKAAGGLVLLGYIGIHSSVPLIKNFEPNARFIEELKVIALDMIATGVTDPTPKDLQDIRRQLDAWGRSSSFASGPVEQAKAMVNSLLKPSSSFGLGNQLKRLLNPSFRGGSFAQPVDMGRIRAVTVGGGRGRGFAESNDAPGIVKGLPAASTTIRSRFADSITGLESIGDR